MQEVTQQPFEKVFDACENRLHAIFTFLALLELIQQRFLNILTGEGRNNFILEWNQNRDADLRFILPATSDTLSPTKDFEEAAS